MQKEMEERRRRKKIYLAVFWVLHCRRKRNREVWVKKWLLRREEFGSYVTLMSEFRSEDAGCFLNFVRMSSDVFDHLLELIRPAIQHQDTHFRRAIPPGLRLAITLRFLATGECVCVYVYVCGR